MKYKMKVNANERGMDLKLEGPAMDLLATLLSVTTDTLRKCAPDEEAFQRIKYGFIKVLADQAKWEEKK